METIELRGKPVVNNLRENIIDRVNILKEENLYPKLLLIRVGDKDNDESYKKSILKNCELLGINVDLKELSEEASEKDLEKIIKQGNEDEKVHGIMVFRPLPKSFNEKRISLMIDEEKDVDCMNPNSLRKIFEGKEDGFLPCTPKAVIEMLENMKFKFEGANVVIVGRSLVVGKPLGMLFLNRNSTISICHSKTKDLKQYTKLADVVVTASGKAKFLDESYFTKDSIVIDVGINVDEENNLCGDVDYENVFGKVKAITPVPGGVGSITTTVLMDQIVKACEKQIEKKKGE